ncbi:FAD:protein FMN transferase [Garciella nitratireducens]|uniref:FAD:protein FMN transferase n=1 Tax=Garciella nitratireducens TaxID=218205 RepID=UPI000DEA2E07|nr:FAD:protein FMN transferase [Garciella nitratireducens]RBP46719.1 thiamine biosynthesis lipoprotein [Garciella nitratireducens]
MKRVFILVISLLFLSSCSNMGRDLTSLEPARESVNAMGTITDFIVYGSYADEGVQKGKEILLDLEQKMSLNRENSEVNQINLEAGKKPVSVSKDTFEVIKRGVYFSKLTAGQFDITIAPITELWNIGQDNQRIPNDKELKKACSLVNYKNIKLDEKKRMVFLEKEGMKIDLGGMAKGYAADKILKTFREMGIENALVSVGGNIKVIGKNPQENRPWKVGLRHPRKARGSYFATLDLKDGQTVVSSGDYERYFIKNKIRYHHIFDAKTGKPSRSGIIGVSIICDNSMDADALSTSVFLLGNKEGKGLIDKIEGVEAVIITDDLEVQMTQGAKSKVKLLEDHL